jgi:hypothetical protein
MQLLNLTARKFGRLTVLTRSAERLLYGLACTFRLRQHDNSNRQKPSWRPYGVLQLPDSKIPMQHPTGIVEADSIMS